MCAAREEYDVSLACGAVRLTALPAPAVLDGTCRIDPEPGSAPLPEQVAGALVLAPETSVLLLVTGAAADLDALARATATLPADTRCRGAARRPRRAGGGRAPARPRRGHRGRCSASCPA